MSSYRELKVWQKSVDLAKDVYELTRLFPKSQQFSLVQQMERSAVSIASNIAEGSGRNGTQEFIQYIGIACGSLYELQTQLIIANKIGFVEKANLDKQINETEEISRMLNGLKLSLKQKAA